MARSKWSMWRRMWSLFERGHERALASLPRRKRPSLTVETLEERVVLAAVLVVNTNDSGTGSLRAAINTADSNPGDAISFNIPTSDMGYSGGVFTIKLQSALPTISATTMIDGTTEASSLGITYSTPIIALDGSSAGSSSDGLNITAGNSTIKGLDIIKFGGTGIALYGSSATGDVVQGNYLGINAAGTSAAANSYGIRVDTGADFGISSGPGSGAASNDTIGGTTAAARNVISGNSGVGVWLLGDNQTTADGGSNVVAGNYIGINASGSGAITNGYWGIEDTNAPNNTIGGTVSGAGNLISGNSEGGVALYGSNATGNAIQGNVIGLESPTVGNAALGNGYSGIYVGTGSGFGFTSGTYSGTAGSTTIGGTATAAYNTISSNGNWGIWLSGSTTGDVIQGNIVGFNTSGGGSFPNSFGDLQIDPGSSASAGGGTLTVNSVIDNGTLDLNGNSISIGALTGSGTLTNSSATAATLTVTGGGTFTGNITGTNTALTVDGGSQTLTLSGNNTYAGATTINAGDILKAGSTTALSSATVVVDNGTLDLNGHSITIGQLTGNGIVTNSSATVATLTVTGGGTFTGNITGASTALTVDGGTKTLVLLGSNTYGGLTTINGSDTLQVGNQSTIASLGSGSVTDNGLLVFDLSYNSTVANAISGSGGLTEEGIGALTLTGSNSYSGTTSINAGTTLQAGSATALSTSSNVSDAGTLNLGGFSVSIGALTGSGTVTNNSIGSVYQIDNGELISSGTYYGFNNSLGSEAEDNWVGNVFTAATGATQLNSISFATFSALNSSTLPSPYVTAALYTGSPSTGLTLVTSSVNTVSLNAGSLQMVTVPFAVSETLTAGQVFTAALLIDDVPNTVFPFIETTLGTNTNSYYDVSKPPGNVNTYNLASPNAPTLNGVNYPGTSATNAGVNITLLRANASAPGTASAATLTVTGGDSFSGNITGTNTSLTVAGTSRTLTLSGNNTYGGITTINAGDTLQIGSGAAIGSLGTGNVTDNGSLIFDLTSSPSIANAISGSGSLTQEGSGTVVLTAANTYSGTTTVNGGTVQVTGGIASSANTVSSPGALVVTVINTTDSGPGSLRQALLTTNNTTGVTPTITFNIPGSGVHVIQPSLALPTIARPVIINGYSQPGSSVNTLASGDNAVLLIELYGASAGSGANGLTITAGNSTVEGLDIGGFSGAGIAVSTNGGNTIQGNFIGINTAGTTALANAGGGVVLSGGATNDLIGTNGDGVGDAGERNVISGNTGVGVLVSGSTSSGNVIAGNYIGSNTAGTAPVANTSDGIQISGALNTRIGTDAVSVDDVGEWNLISGNGGSGVDLTAGASHTVVAGNYIGVTADGTSRLSNAAAGVVINGSAQNLIGTDGTHGAHDVDQRNVIVASTGGYGAVQISGVGANQNVVAGNYLGCNAAGTAGLQNNGGSFFPVVYIIGGAQYNLIGTNGDGVGDADERNLISESAWGVLISDPGTDYNVVAGNYIGTDYTGLAPMPNASYGTGTLTGNWFKGVSIVNAASDNIIGTNGNSADDAGEGNVISGNTAGFNTATTGYGVTVEGAGTNNNVIAGNYIGVNSAGTGALANSNYGIWVTGGPQGTRIGTAGTDGANDVYERNVISGNTNAGIAIEGTGTSSTTVAGNYIGTDYTGTVAIANSGDGIRITTGATNNIIGGTLAGTSNLIAGNSGNGIVVTDSGTTGNVIEGNLIGLKANGTGQANGNDGVLITNGAASTTVGGTTASARNVISGNANRGVEISGAGTTANDIEGNYLGTDTTGGTGLGNSGAGVYISSSAGNVIGGTVAGASNVISGNLTYGIRLDTTANSDLIEGNFIGTNAAGNASIGNSNYGIWVEGSNDTIGGTVPGAGNLISGNKSDGINVSSGGGGSIIAGNFIGINAPGNAALANAGNGVTLNSSAGNLIGGLTTGARNVISGNTVAGIELTGSGTSGNAVEGNFIGTNATGSATIGNVSNGIQLDTGAGSNTIGGTVTGAGNVISGNGQSSTFTGGVMLTGTGTSGNVVAGNLIGTDSTGSVKLGNAYDGVLLLFGASGNTIGGTTAAARNVIAGSLQSGVEFNVSGTSNNVVEGNYIGTDSTGTHALPNGFGVFIQGGASSETIGGTVAGAGNLISGNSYSGIEITGATSSNNVVAGNFIGTTANGSATLSNAGNGIQIDTGSSGNVIGGTTVTARNVISGNYYAGINIFNTTGNLVEGNFIGINAAGNGALGNAGGGVQLNTAANETISGNVVSGNSGVGVFITNAGDGNVIQSDYLGTDSTGLVSIPNTSGVDLNAVSYTGTLTVLNSTLGGALDAVPGSSNTLVLGAVTAGQITVSGGSIDTTGNLSATFGAIALTGSVTLESDSALAAAGGNISFNGTVNGAHNLTVNTTGTTTFGGSIGGTAPLASLTTDASGSTPGITDLNGAVTTTGTVAFNDPVYLGADVTVTDNGPATSSITFGSTLDSIDVADLHSLTLVSIGPKLFVGAVGSQSPLSSLYTDASPPPSISADAVYFYGGAVTTTGNQTYSDSVTLSNNTTLSGANIDFGYTVDSDSVSTPRALTVNLNGSGTTIFGGAVGSKAPLASLTTNTNGSTDLNGGAVTTFGNQLYNNGSVSLGAEATLTSTAGSVSFAGTVDGAHNLTISSNATTTFGGLVGSITPLTSLNVYAGSAIDLNGGLINTTLGQTYNGAALLGVNTTLNGTNVSFIGTVDGAYSLTINNSGVASFGGAVGSNVPLASFTTNYTGSTAINGGAITTISGQAYNDSVTLGANATLTSSSGSVSFFNVVNGPGSLTVSSSGVTIFNAAVGGDTALASLTVTGFGSSALNGGAVTTTGAQIYAEPTTLGASATTLTSTNNGDITFVQTVDGASSLYVNTGGVTSFDGVVGGSTPLVRVVTDAAGATVIGGSMTTSGDLTFNDPVYLSADVILTDAGAQSTGITFNSTVDSDAAASLTAFLYQPANASTLATFLAGDTGANAAYGSGGSAGQQALLDYLHTAAGTSAIHQFVVNNIATYLVSNISTLEALLTSDANALSAFLSGGDTGAQAAYGTGGTAGVNALLTYLQHPDSGEAADTITLLAYLKESGSGGQQDILEYLHSNPTVVSNYDQSNPVAQAIVAHSLTVESNRPKIFNDSIGANFALSNLFTNIDIFDTTSPPPPASTYINTGIVTTTNDQNYQDNLVLAGSTSFNAGGSANFAGTVSGGGTAPQMITGGVNTSMINVSGWQVPVTVEVRAAATSDSTVTVYGGNSTTFTKTADEHVNEVLVSGGANSVALFDIVPDSEVTLVSQPGSNDTINLSNAFALAVQNNKDGAPNEVGISVNLANNSGQPQLAYQNLTSPDIGSLVDPSLLTTVNTATLALQGQFGYVVLGSGATAYAAGSTYNASGQMQPGTTFYMQGTGNTVYGAPGATIIGNMGNNTVMQNFDQNQANAFLVAGDQTSSDATSLASTVAQNQTAFLGSTNVQQALLTNPGAQQAILSNSAVQSAILNSPVATQAIFGEPAAQAAILNSPASVGAILGSSTAVGAILSNPAAQAILGQNSAIQAILGKPGALSAILGNPATLQAVLKNPSAVQAILSSPTALQQIVANPSAVAAILGDPGAVRAIIANNSSVQAIIGNANAVQAIISNNTSLQAIVANPNAVGAIIGNPIALAAILGNNTAVAAVLGSNTAVQALISNPTALAAVIANPNAIAAILGNSTALAAVLSSNAAVQAIVSSNTAVQAIIGNPTAFGAIIANSSAVAAILGNLNAVAAIISNTTALAAIVGNNAALGAIINNPTAINAIIGTPGAVGAILNNPAAQAILSLNPAVQAILNNAASVQAIISAQTAVSAILSNPADLAAVLGNHTLVQAIIGSPTLMGQILGNPTVLAQILGNPSAVQALLSNNTAIAAIIGNNTILASILGNSSAIQAILGNNAGVAAVVGTPGAVQAIFGSQTAVQAVIGNQTALSALLANPLAVQAIISNSTALAAILAVPGAVGAILGNPLGVAAVLANNTATAALLGNNTAVQAILNDPNALAAVLNLPAAVAAIINVPAALSAILNSPTGVAAIIANPLALQELLNNQTALNAILATPAAANAIANDPAGAAAVGNSSIAAGTGLASQAAPTIASDTTTGQSFLTPTLLEVLLNDPILRNIILGIPQVQEALLGTPSVLTAIFSDPTVQADALQNPTLLATFFNNPAVQNELFGSNSATFLPLLLANNPAVLQAFFASDPTVLNTFLSQNPSVESTIFTAADTGNVRLNVTLAGSGNQATGGFLSTFNIGANSLFTESITPAQLAIVNQALSDGLNINNFALNVTINGGNNVVVGGLMGNFTINPDSTTTSNRFVIEDPSFLGVQAGTAPSQLYVNGGTFNGSGKNDTFYFVGGASGNNFGTVTLNEPARAATNDTLDFSNFTGGGLNLNLATITPQAVTSGLTLTLPTTISNVIGTSSSDTITGNSLNDTIQGSAVDNPDQFAQPAQPPSSVPTQWVVLNFDSFVMPPSTEIDPTNNQVVYISESLHDGTGIYSLADQVAVLTAMQTDYADFPLVQFSLDPAELATFTNSGLYTSQQIATYFDLPSSVQTSGAYETVFFNETPIFNHAQSPGGQSSEIDFRNLNVQTTVEVDVNGVLGDGIGQIADTDSNWVNLSATIAAHEVGHTLGLRHEDAFGPIGFGISNPPGPDEYFPIYPGLVGAFTTDGHIITSPAAVGSTLEDAADGDAQFGEREAVVLAFITGGTVVEGTNHNNNDGPYTVVAPVAVNDPIGPIDLVNETALISNPASSGTPTTVQAQPIYLYNLNVPNPITTGFDAGKTFDVAAVDVLGYFQGHPDFYTFTGQGGDLMNFEVKSAALTRLGSNTIDSVIYLYGPNGQLLVWNDDQFEPSDSSIIDFTLPTTGTYTVEVDSYQDATGQPATPGDYELFMYHFDAYNGASGNDTLIAGTGNDMLIGGTGNTTFIFNANAIGNNTVIGGTGNNTLQATANNNFSLTSNKLTGLGGSQPVNFAGIQNVILTDTGNSHAFSIDPSYTGTLTLIDASGSDTLTTQGLNAITTTLNGSLVTVSDGSSLVNPLTINGNVSQFNVNGSISSTVIVSGNVTTAAINGALTSKGSLYVGGNLNELYIGSTTSNGMTVAPTGQLKGDDLAGQLTVGGTLYDALIAGGTPGTIMAGKVGTVRAYGGYGPFVLQITDNKIERLLVASVVSATPGTGSDYPIAVAPPSPPPPASPNNVYFQYVYEGTQAMGNSLVAQLTTRVTNSASTAKDQYDLSLETYNDAAKFNLVRLDAASVTGVNPTGVSGIRNISVEGDMSATVTSTAAAFFSGDTNAAGIWLSSDALAAVGIRNYANNGEIHAKSIQAIAFGASPSAGSGATASAANAAALLASSTTIVQANDTFRVPFADINAVGLFISTTAGSFNSSNVALKVQSNNGVQSNAARGAVTGMVTVNTGNIQAIALRGDGGSVTTSLNATSITSGGSMGDIILQSSSGLPSTMTVTAASIFGNIKVTNGSIAGTIQTTGTRIDPITGASSSVVGDIGIVTAAGVPTVITATQTISGKIISAGSIYSQFGPMNGSFGGYIKAAGDIGAVQGGNANPTWTNNQLTIYGGVTNINGNDTGTIIAGGNLYSNLTVNGSMSGTVSAGGNLDGTVIFNGNFTGSITVGGNLGAANFDSYGHLAIVPAAGSTPAHLALSGTLTINGSDSGVLLVGGNSYDVITLNGSLSGQISNSTVNGVPIGTPSGGEIVTQGNLVGAMTINGGVSGLLAVGGDVGAIALTSSGNASITSTNSLVRFGGIIISGNLTGDVLVLGNFFSDFTLNGSVSGRMAVQGQDEYGLNTNLGGADNYTTADARIGMLGNVKINGSISSTGALVSGGVIGDDGLEYNPSTAAASNSSNIGTLATVSSNSGILAAAEDINGATNTTSSNGYFQDLDYSISNKYNGGKNIVAVDKIFSGGMASLNQMLGALDSMQESGTSTITVA